MSLPYLTESPCGVRAPAFPCYLINLLKTKDFSKSSGSGGSGPVMSTLSASKRAVDYSYLYEGCYEIGCVVGWATVTSISGRGLVQRDIAPGQGGGVHFLVTGLPFEVRDQAIHLYGTSDPHSPVTCPAK